MTTIAELRTNLEAIPDPLLGPDERIVRDEALTSLDALSMFDVVPVAVAFVGSSGSGKSMLVNECVGDPVAAVSPIRPTTTRVLMAGSSGPVSLAVESDYAHAPNARGGVVFIDTPSWEHDESAVIAAMVVADLVVVVVTPSRYADATVARLIGRLPEGRPSAVVLNRIATSAADRDSLVESVHATYGADVVTLDEGGDVERAVEEMLVGLEIDTLGYQRAAVLRASAASGARHLAGAVTSLAPDIGELAERVDRYDPTAEHVDLPVLETWEESRATIANDIVRRISRVDAALEVGEVAERVGRGLDEVGGGPFAAALDVWKRTLDERCTSAARIRWRRKAALALIDQYAWRLGLHPELDAPPRLRRILRDSLDPITADAQAQVQEIATEAVAARVEAWSVTAASLGSFTPGSLLAAADGFSPRGERPDG